MMTAVLMVGWEWSLRLEDAGLGEGMPNTVQLVADPGLSNISGRNFKGNQEARADPPSRRCHSAGPLCDLGRKLCGFVDP
jgi:hypothetical protein